ncbi:MAG: hypothetical protein AAF495_17720 [Pseudomonadota bacterium]
MPGNSVETALPRLQTATDDPNWEAFAIEFLQDQNWRLHLIASSSLLYRPSERVLSVLWQTFDRGSWVAPQMGAVAYLCDPHFPENARKRIGHAGGDEAGDLDDGASERLSERQLAKNAAVLLELCSNIVLLSSWVKNLRRQPAKAKMSQLDSSLDNATRITARWLTRVVVLLARQGVHLTPAYKSWGRSD